MHQSLPVAAMLFALAAAPAAVLAEPSMVASPPVSSDAPESVRVQPRGHVFAPNSAEDDAVQKQLSIFNAKQQLLDAELDRKLNICRRCGTSIGRSNSSSSLLKKPSR